MANYNDKNISKEKRERALAILKEMRESLGTSDVEQLLKIVEVEKYIDSETYGLKFEQHSEEVLERLDKEVPVLKFDDTRKVITSDSGMNYIIEGDNLHALYLLAKTHKHSIDMIYIDPPYNTGAKDWKYNNNYVDNNDGYRHSKWLSMMNERLKIAKNLLKPDGVLVCAIDENELATISLLLEDLFGLDYHIDTICVVHNPRGVQGDNFSYVNEYALFVYKKGLKVIEDTTIPEDEIDWTQFRNWGDESLRSDARNCFYPVFVNENLEVVGCGAVSDDNCHPKQTEFNKETNLFEVYPIDLGGVERKWRYATQSFASIQKLLRAKKGKDDRIEIEIGKPFGTYKTVWQGKIFDANTYGTQLINDMVPTNDFDFPKSLYNVYECLNAVVRNRPNAIVLDFFAGSGTTGHAVLLMNKLLGGNRHFILATNNAIGEKREKEFAKLYPHLVNEDKTLKTESDEYKVFEEKYGIARSITFPRIKAAIEGYVSSKGGKTMIYEKKLTQSILLNDSKMKKVKEEIEKAKEANEKLFDKFDIKYEDEALRLYGLDEKNQKVDGLGGNVLYFKTEFVPIMSEDDSLFESLMTHIKEMVSLFEMKAVDDKRIVVDDDQLLEVLQAIKDFEGQNVYICPDVLIGEDDRQLMSRYNINIYEIPQLFFDRELRKAGEL